MSRGSSGQKTYDVGKTTTVRSEATVKAHVSRSLAKLGLANRVQIALLVRDAGHG